MDTPLDKNKIEIKCANVRRTCSSLCDNKCTMVKAKCVFQYKSKNK